jgi:tripartite-type tricarboxylate transporter receptor subunit TctC
LLRAFSIALGFCLVSLGVLAAANAQDYPARPIKIVVGFGPGGLGDITARAVAQKMSDSFGKPVVIENMPGAGGMSAAVSVARAAPDGHTLLLVSGQNAASPSLFKSMPYDWANDFVTVSTIGLFDFIIVVGKDSPLKNVGDLIATAKREPSRFNIGTISVGSVQNLSAHLFASMTGLQVTTVPFRTTGEIVTALLSDQVQVGFETTPGVLGQVQSGNLRALGVSSDKPLPFLPGVPAVAPKAVSPASGWCRGTAW